MDDPRTDSEREQDDLELIENAIADAGAGILPGGLTGIHAKLDAHALRDEPDEATDIDRDA